LQLSIEIQNGRLSIHLKYFTFQIECWRCPNAERPIAGAEGGGEIQKTVENTNQNARCCGHRIGGFGKNS